MDLPDSPLYDGGTDREYGAALGVLDIMIANSVDGQIPLYVGMVLLNKLESEAKEKGYNV